MNVSIIKSALTLRWDASAPLWNGGSTAEFELLNQSLPVDLVHHRFWMAAFVNPQFTALPCFKMRVVLEQENGSRIQLFDWSVDYKNVASLGVDPTIEATYTDIKPPYAVTNESGNPDRSTSPHSGAGDARILQFRHQEGGGPISVIRVTMWPVNVTAKLRRVIYTIRDFTSDPGSWPEDSGNIFTAFVMQSQAFPFS